MFVKVYIDRENENVDMLYTYEADMPLCIGQRVLVPFSRGNRPIEGYVIGISDTCEYDPSKIKKVIRPLEDYPVVDEKQIELAEWIKKTYHCTSAHAYRLFIPAQLRGGRISEKKKRCVHISDKDKAKEYQQSLISKNGKIRSQGAYDTIDFLLQSESDVAVEDLLVLVPKSTSAIVKRLIEAEVLTETFQTVFRRPKKMQSEHIPIPTLTDEQQTAYERLCSGMEKGGGTYLLHGVTGSGKTEVYMQAISYALSHKKGAIVLVPEISLTPQTVERFNSRFGDRVAVLHSRLSPGERFDEWRRIRLGMVDVVVGARSAVFAPVKDLGIIIIDEEHENSYMSETVPKYNAIETARYRCKQYGAILVLGSATPSVNTYYRACMHKYELIELKKRVNDYPLPVIDVIDMRREFLAGNNGIFSEALAQRLKACIESGEQAILFLNRRGYSNFVTCRACGYIWKCDDCDVSMTYHKHDGRMKCHYCGIEKEIPKTCPNCGKSYIKFNGYGTEQIEEELRKRFPDVSCIRMDADTTKRKDSHIALLSEFASGRAQVLIGTQMIAKGLDFPNVTLVGIVSVDAMLAMPDFRNTERTFALLTQVAGRAGRAEKRGSVVLQTNNPEHPIIDFAVRHDYKAFYAYAIQNRQVNLYPPFSVFVRILFTADEEAQSNRDSVGFSNTVYKAMCDVLHGKGAKLGEIAFIYAMPAPIRRISAKYRHHVLIKLARTKNTKLLLDAIYACADEFEGESLMNVEVNPNDML